MCAIVLLGFEFCIKFCKTADFGRVDGLSISISSHRLEDGESVRVATSAEQATVDEVSVAVRATPPTVTRFIWSTFHDPILPQAVILVRNS